MPDHSRSIRVEFFGIPRARAGAAETVVELMGEGVTFGSLLAILAQRFPDFGSQCLVDNLLSKSFAANVQGERFLQASDDLVRSGETVLIFSADAGG